MLKTLKEYYTVYANAYNLESDIIDCKRKLSRQQHTYYLFLQYFLIFIPLYKTVICINSMKEIFKDLIDGFNNRLKNPLLFTYLISFIIYNWKQVLILIYGKHEIEFKIIQLLYKSSYLNWFIPLVSSIVYVISVPYILYLIELSQRKREKLYNSLTNNRLDEKEIIDGKIAEQQRKLEQIRAGTSEIQELLSRNNDLEVRLETLTNDNNELSKIIQARNDKSSSEIRELLNRNNDLELKIDVLKEQNDGLSKAIQNENNISSSQIKELTNKNEELLALIDDLNNGINKERTMSRAKEKEYNIIKNKLLELEQKKDLIQPEAQKTYDKIINRNDGKLLLSALIDIAANKFNEENFPRTIIEYLIINGLISKTRGARNKTLHFYSLSELGQEVFAIYMK